MTESELNTLAIKVADLICIRIGLLTLANANTYTTPTQPANWITARKLKELTGLSISSLYCLREQHPEIQRKLPKRQPHQQRSAVLWNLTLILKILEQTNEL